MAIFVGDVTGVSQWVTWRRWNHAGGGKAFLGTSDDLEFLNEAKKEFVDHATGLDGYCEGVTY